MTNIRNVDAKLSDQIKYLTQVSTGKLAFFAHLKLNVDRFLVSCRPPPRGQLVSEPEDPADCVAPPGARQEQRQRTRPNPEPDQSVGAAAGATAATAATTAEAPVLRHQRKRRR